MGQDTTMIALDSNAMTYWIAAMSAVSAPPEDPCKLEKVALARIFFWLSDESGFNLTPTVETEYQAIKDQQKLADHVSWAMALLSPVRPLPDPKMVMARETELSIHHSGTNDCRIVAESELTQIKTLLTCDPRLEKNLRPVSKCIQICKPTEYWQLMSIPNGTKPVRIPRSTNPMSQCSWWHW